MDISQDSPQSLDPLHSKGTSLLANELISICIPTYKRPDLLVEALRSCFAQTYSRLEIVIGDDSPDDATADIIARLIPEHPGSIRYLHHVPPAGQIRNVDDLFRRAQGSRLMLLHDDDLLEPDALERLSACWRTIPNLDAAFGKQTFVTHEGLAIAAEESEQLNVGYQRQSSNAGLLPVPIVAGISRMFPNDGYLLRTELAREVGYIPKQEVGDACDTDFGLRFCGAAERIWYLDEFTCKYRVSRTSVGKTAILAPYTYELLCQLSAPPEAQAELSRARKEIAPSAVSGYARLGCTAEAMRTFLSPNYSWQQRLSLRGAYHLALILRFLFREPRRGVRLNGSGY